MKRFYLLLITVLVFIYGKYNAQITITSADMPEAGDIFIYDNSADILTQDFSLTGAGHTWDYSTATSTLVDSLMIVSVGSTPLAYQFYFNNQFTQPDHYSDYAQRGQDLDAMGQVSIDDRYDYFGVNSSSLEIKGYGANVNGVPASVKYDTIDQIYPFPMTYGMPTHNSSGYYISTIPSLGTYGQWIRREVTVDGYGSLTTPNATYPNTIRVKTVLLQTDTVYVDQFMFGQTIDRPEETIYEWFTNTEKSPVMRVVIRNAQATEAKYLLEVTSGTEELLGIEYSLRTEDANGLYSIQNAERVENIRVYDVSSKLIGTYSYDSIDLRNEPSGVYFIVVREEAKDHCFKVVK